MKKKCLAQSLLIFLFLPSTIALACMGPQISFDVYSDKLANTDLKLTANALIIDGDALTYEPNFTNDKSALVPSQANANPITEKGRWVIYPSGGGAAITLDRLSNDLKTADGNPKQVQITDANHNVIAIVDMQPMTYTDSSGDHFRSLPVLYPEFTTVQNPDGTQTYTPTGDRRLVISPYHSDAGAAGMPRSGIQLQNYTTKDAKFPDSELKAVMDEGAKGLEAPTQLDGKVNLSAKQPVNIEGDCKGMIDRNLGKKEVAPKDSHPIVAPKKDDLKVK